MEKTNGVAIAALILGIAGLIFFWVPIIGLIIGIVAVIMGIVALNKIKKTHEQGKPMAIIGLVAGGVGLIAGLVMLIGMIAFFGAVSPSKLVPDMCSFGGPFTCGDFMVQSDSVSLVLEPTQDVRILSANLELMDGKTTTISEERSVATGDKTTLTFNLTNSNFNKGDKAKMTVSIEYVLGDSEIIYSHIVKGEIIGTVE